MDDKIKDKIISLMRSKKVSVYRKPKDVVFVTESEYEQYFNALRREQRFSDQELSKKGIVNLLLDGRPVVLIDSFLAFLYSKYIDE